MLPKSFRVPEPLWNKIAKLAKKNGVSGVDQVRDILRDHFARGEEYELLAKRIRSLELRMAEMGVPVPHLPRFPPVESDEPEPFETVIEEHDVVQIRKEFEDQGVLIGAGTMGTVVAIHEGGKAYSVELEGIHAVPFVATVEPENIFKATR